MDRVKHEEKENVGVNCEEKQGHARAVCEASEFNDETMERIVLRAELTAKMSDELGSLNFLSNGSGGRYDDTLSYHVISNRCQLDPNQCELKLIWLLQLSNMFSAHLPAMNTEYITRVVFDERHRSLIIVKNRREVIAGACFRLFPKRGFSELAFFAVSHDEQLKGYGKRLMALLQDYHTSECHIYHILTYADKTATRFFKKQGFSANIKLDKERYDGYIRHYKYAIFMDCQLDPSIVYSLLNENGETLKKLYKCAVEELNVDHNRLYEGINEDGDKRFPLSKIAGLEHSPQIPAAAKQHDVEIKRILDKMKNHKSAWPFLKPVDADRMPQNDKTVEYPMDLQIMNERLDRGYYVHERLFIADLRRMLNNCFKSNPTNSTYYEAGYELCAVARRLVKRAFPKSDIFPELPSFKPH